MFYFLIFIGLIYFIGFAILRYGFKSMQTPLIPIDYKPSLKFSIVVPARNEEHNIVELIHSFRQLNYPESHYELIIVDDLSEDSTVEKILPFCSSSIRLLQLENLEELSLKNKKRALHEGIQIAHHDFIITTDADCVFDKNWLRTIAYFIERDQSRMAIAPVSFSNDGTLLAAFQSLDFMMMQSIGISLYALGSASMNNGANFVFEKQLFFELKGFQGVDQIASGDDFLFLNKYRQTANPKISYAFHPEAIVQTLPQDNVRGFFQQRVRWASKMGNYKNVLLTSTLVFVFFFNLCCLILFVMAFSNTHYVMLCITLIVLKIIAEALLLSKAKRFFNFKNAYTILISLQFPHIIYMVSAALFSKLKTYEWKGRILR